MGILREKRYNQPVVKLDKKGNILKRWESASEAERDEGAGKNAISRCCRESGVHIGGLLIDMKVIFNEQ